MLKLSESSPINFRKQNGGDRTFPLLQLKDGIENIGENFKLHVLRKVPLILNMFKKCEINI